MYEGEMMKKGGRVWVIAEDETEVDVPAGDYVLESGMTLVVTEDGKVDSLIEAPTEDAPITEDAPAEMAEPEAPSEGKVNQDEKIASEIESAIKSILIKYSEQQETITQLKSQLDEIGKQPSSKGIKQAEVQVDLSKLRPVEKFRLTK